MRAVPPPFVLRGVSTGPPDDPVLQSLSVDIPCEGITVIAGPSGAGKSSLLRLLDRLEDPRTGSIDWRGRSLADHEPVELARVRQPQHLRLGPLGQLGALDRQRQVAVRRGLAVGGGHLVRAGAGA